MPRTRRRGTGGRFDKGGGRSDGRFSLHPENPILESRMHATVPVRFGRGRLDSLGNKGLAAYLMRKSLSRRTRQSNVATGPLMSEAQQRLRPHWSYPTIEPRRSQTCFKRKDTGPVGLLKLVSFRVLVENQQARVFEQE